MKLFVSIIKRTFNHKLLNFKSIEIKQVLVADRSHDCYNCKSQLILRYKLIFIFYVINFKSSIYFNYWNSYKMERT